MPRRNTHELRWDQVDQSYTLWIAGDPNASAFAPASPAWNAWLDATPSFTFTAQSGANFTARQEKVQRGGTYWYAYRRVQGRLVKRYLGRSTDLTLDRLEALAEVYAGLASADSLNLVADVPQQRSTRYGTKTTQRHVPLADEQALPLLATKFQVPHAPALALERLHIQQRLLRGLTVPWTVLVAPAGFGKTTALVHWARTQAHLPAWVALDGGENDPEQFWMYLLTALEQAYSGLAQSLLAHLRAPQPPPMTVIIHLLLNAIAAQPEPVILVLDDFHHITAPAIHEALGLIVAHPPEQLHVYSTLRNEIPPLLARMRPYGQINEIRADDLRFRPDEVAAFMNDTMGLALDGENLLRLAERTDGWITGVQIAGLALQHHHDPAQFLSTFDGSHRHVLAYLDDEVLAAQSADIQAFLVQTAFLDRLCAPLCDAVTGRTDSKRLIAQIEQANLFIVALDDQHGWYRYYHLFGDRLRHSLQQTQPAQLVQLRRRAAAWFHAEGYTAEAVTHYCAIPDYDAATHLILEAGKHLLLHGEMMQLQNLILRLPEAIVAGHPALCMYHIIVLFYRGQLDVVELRLKQAEAALTVGTYDDATLTEWRGQIAGSHATLSAMRGQVETVFTYAETALALLSTTDNPWRAGVSVCLGLAHKNRGELRAASVTLAKAARECQASGNRASARLAMSLQSYVLFEMGQLRQSEDVLRQLIRHAAQDHDSVTSTVISSYVTLANIAYMRNDLAAAKESLALAFAAAEYSDDISIGDRWLDDEIVNGMLRLAFIYQAEGKVTEAHGGVQKAAEMMRQLERDGRVFPWLPPQVMALTARLALQQGNTAAAEQWSHARNLDTNAVPLYDDVSVQAAEFLLLARLWMAQGRDSDAMRLLDRIMQTARAREHARCYGEILLLQALCQQSQGQTAAALATLRDALSATAPEGNIRVFIDEGAATRALLLRLRERLPRHDALRRVCDAILSGYRNDSDAPTSSPAGQLIEPLSEREREVLALLATGQSNSAMAHTLIVAVSTIKTHLHHIYAKLGVTDRVQALNRARALSLLD
ncbi:MAG: hypothetical protein H0X24_03595 [Ktedonobacterales bacterium]|nr:hypothetical protein [Ktedonobacterales bacterium]